MPNELPEELRAAPATTLVHARRNSRDPMDLLEEARRLFLDALALHQKGELEPARALYEKALALAPGRASVMNNLATVYLEQKKFLEARRLCESVLEQEPADEVALVNLGNCQIRLNAAEEALLSYEKALALRPDYADAINNRGNALLELKRPQEALASYEQALAIRPDYAEALYNRGNALLELRRPQEALASYEQALAIRPGYAEALYNRGNVLRRRGQLEEALASYDRALAIAPDHVAGLNNRSLVLLELDRREELIDAYQRLLSVAPDHPYTRGYLLHARLKCCEWADYDKNVAQITDDVRVGKRADSPFHFLVISESPVDQLRCSRTCVADEYPAAAQPVWRGERYGHDRIRVAYLSADLHGHAIPYLIAGLIEAHDRTRFEITAVSLGPDREDEMRARLKAAFDRFIDVRDRSDREVAGLLRELEIDIAVDLQGFTSGCRTGIFAHRGAPIQVNWLGFPGTLGADYIDYIVGDRILIPEEHQPHYAEKVVTLPDCYQPNDDKRRIAERTPTRAELGLPERGFVYCCFNNNHKITPRVFDTWMRLLARVEGGVLWLLKDHATVERNLRREAEQRGVAPTRLVFAPRVKMEEHLARHRLADLFLDTLPYNAHVTASDALWTGLPVLTHRGNAFAGRVAASLLGAVGLPELITSSWEDYEALALKLAVDSKLLADIKAKLAQNRATHPLFDTDRFRRHIESAYSMMWERFQRGDGPASFGVRPA
ncbi:MAG: tetratricopeptide repeat protein [Burkholderiales bacterium]